MLMEASVRNDMNNTKTQHTIEGREEGKRGREEGGREGRREGGREERREEGKEGRREEGGREGERKREKRRGGEGSKMKRGRETEERGGRNKCTPLYAHAYLPTKGLRLSEESRKAHRRPMRCSLPLSCSTIANTSDVSSSQAM